MNYVLHLLVYVCIYSTATLGLNFILGSCGRLSLAHGAYFAVGCYSYALGRVVLGLDFAVSVGFAAIVAAGLSVPLAVMGRRYRGDFFVLMSLAVQVLVLSAITCWFKPGAALGSWSNLTNGPFGIAGVSGPEIAGWRAQTPAQAIALFLPCLLIVGVLSFVWLRSPWGRTLRALRDDELAARGLGKPMGRFLTQAFALGCGFAGIGGALYAAYAGYIDPSVASLDQGVILVSMLVVGGSGNIRGPIVGALIFLLLPEVLRAVPMAETVAASARAFIFGILLILVVHLRPHGLAGVYRVE